MREGKCDREWSAKRKHNVKLQWKVIQVALPPPRVSSGGIIAQVVGRGLPANGMVFRCRQCLDVQLDAGGQ
jgi:hypothetical protein